MKSKLDLIRENEALRRIIEDIHWMARRYADGRSSYAASTYNERMRVALRLGVKLTPTRDGIIWARDGGGRHYDKLTELEATPGTAAAIGDTV